jgi:hypothetical protein
VLCLGLAGGVLAGQASSETFDVLIRGQLEHEGHEGHEGHEVLIK